MFPVGRASARAGSSTLRSRATEVRSNPLRTATEDGSVASPHQTDHYRTSASYALNKNVAGALTSRFNQPVPNRKPMAIRKLTTGESCELVVPGRIDGALANQLEIDILAAIREGFNSIYVNLAEASFLCSAGMRVLLQYHRQMKNNKKTLLVTRPSPEVDSILELTGFRELIVEGAKPQGAV